MADSITPSDLRPDSQPKETAKRRTGKPQLKVVFDTSVVYVPPASIGSISDLIKPEVADLISQSEYPDLEILWFVPHIVRHERQFQMQAEAQKLRPAIEKLERLLAYNTGFTLERLTSEVNTRIESSQKLLHLQELQLDSAVVDWPELILSAAYRRPPFKAGAHEAGFRDALVVESFVQLVNGSPKAASSCRLVLVAADGRLAEAASARISDCSNASVLRDIEELKLLINTIVSDVTPDFIARITPKAGKLFFRPKDEKTVFYKVKIRDLISKKFASELDVLPTGTTFRENNNVWRVSEPNFSRKDGQRVYWTSRIKVPFEAGVEAPSKPVPNLLTRPITQDVLIAESGAPVTLYGLNTDMLNIGALGEIKYDVLSGYGNQKTITQRGDDIFEVRWSSQLTVSKQLRKPVVDEI